jgi:ATP-dependent DNA ligase
LWVHEIKHDGYRLMVRRDGLRIRCFTRNGHDWADRFPSIVGAALDIKANSFLIDGEAIILGDDGTYEFNALRNRGSGGEVIFVAFDGNVAPRIFCCHNPATYTAIAASCSMYVLFCHLKE